MLTLALGRCFRGAGLEGAAGGRDAGFTLDGQAWSAIASGYGEGLGEIEEFFELGDGESGGL